ncbi:hypothetical protein [Echinicola rosea]|uniref:Uncharacterized protein n=1 Tax=Echinicola rosea TaxID=1807691 RepID=A0ABQ1UZ51_9BACT|nr:hypothetical protein [Echinicola rosea]GGF31388.1 hypothetical protein GCM10011339_19480 [Echinicola rosea]
MVDIKPLKKIKGRRINGISALAGTLYESGRFCLEGKMEWRLWKQDMEPLHLSLLYNCKELGVDDTYDLIVKRLPLKRDYLSESKVGSINPFGFHLQFESDLTVKHLSLYHFVEESVGKVYENNILLKFEDGTSLLVQPQGYIPFINFYRDASTIKKELEDGIETVVF